MGGNLLTDEEWTALCQCILAVNRADTDENARYQAMLYLMRAVPFQAAAFFIAGKTRDAHAGCLIVQPAGVNMEIERFERWLRAASLGEGEPTRALSNEEGHSAVRWLTDEQGRLGAIVLRRTKAQGAFSPRDLLVLDALAPHIELHLGRLRAANGVAALRVEPLLNEYQLTKRELEVMSCTAFGMTADEIAVKLSISPRTAKKHLENIYRKVGVNNRMSLMRLSQQYMSGD